MEELEQENDRPSAYKPRVTAAGASTPPLAGQQRQRRPSPSTRMPYTESIFDAERAVCADAELGGECE